VTPPCRPQAPGHVLGSRPDPPQRGSEPLADQRDYNGMTPQLRAVRAGARRMCWIQPRPPFLPIYRWQGRAEKVAAEILVVRAAPERPFAAVRLCLWQAQRAAGRTGGAV